MGLPIKGQVARREPYNSDDNVNLLSLAIQPRLLGLLSG